MIDVTVKVPGQRLADFYAMFGAWLGGASGPAEPLKAGPTGWSAEDGALAAELWGKFSEAAQGLYSILIDAPGEKFSGEELAKRLGLAKGKYGIAGVLAWPGRYAAAAGRHMPIAYEDGPAGAGANYWLTPELAALFGKARG